MSESPAKPDRFRLIIIIAALAGAGWYLKAHPEILRREAPPEPRQMAFVNDYDPRAEAKKLDMEAEGLIRDTIRDGRDELAQEFRLIDGWFHEGLKALQQEASQRRRDAADRISKTHN